MSKYELIEADDLEIVDEKSHKKTVMKTIVITLSVIILLVALGCTVYCGIKILDIKEQIAIENAKVGTITMNNRTDSNATYEIVDNALVLSIIYEQTGLYNIRVMSKSEDGTTQVAYTSVETISDIETTYEYPVPYNKKSDYNIYILKY